ncbi:MAG TPA: helix-turn-helix domain-containing protein [Kofleriaceae bacterium]|nr:helix-turn-helix domain-containing protein [Kofleriaceae bacterium]
MVTARKLQADSTRKKLFAAAVQLFAAHGYHATTVDAIARRVGVAKGTFFVHFPTKDAVILRLLAVQTGAARAARDAALGEGPHAALRAAVMTLSAQAGASRELSRAVLAATLDSAEVAHDANALFGVVLDDMIVDARAARARDPERLARGLLAAYLGAAYHFAASRDSEGMTELVAPLVEALLEQEGSREAARRRRRRR